VAKESKCSKDESQPRLNYEDPNIGTFLASPIKKKNCGRKPKYNRDDVREAILLVPTYRHGPTGGEPRIHLAVTKSKLTNRTL
jgi:hypothetical protein